MKIYFRLLLLVNILFFIGCSEKRRILADFERQRKQFDEINKYAVSISNNNTIIYISNVKEVKRLRNNYRYDDKIAQFLNEHKLQDITVEFSTVCTDNYRVRYNWANNRSIINSNCQKELQNFENAHILISQLDSEWSLVIEK